MFRLEKIKPEDGEIIIVRYSDKLSMSDLKEPLGQIKKAIKKFAVEREIHIEVIFLPMDYELECRDSVSGNDMLTGAAFIEALEAM